MTTPKALIDTSNLSDVASAATSRTNLGLGTAATLASDTDGTLAANSDTRVATQKATKTYVDALAATAYTDENAQDAIGAMVDGTIVYVDATPLLTRAALTGDVTAAQASNATTIANGAVTLAKQADMATASVVYRKTAGAGAPEVNTLATLKTDLGLTGTNSGDQTITLTGDVTGSGTGSFAATIANDAVTFAKMQNLATDRLVGRDTAGIGDPEEIAVSGGIEFSGATAIQRSALTGDVTAPAGSNATTVANKFARHFLFMGA